MDDDGNEVVKVRTRRGGREGRTAEGGEEESRRELVGGREKSIRASRLTSAFDDERGRIRGSFASSSATPGAFNGGEKSLSALPPGRNLTRNSAIFASRRPPLQNTTIRTRSRACLIDLARDVRELSISD